MRNLKFAIPYSFKIYGYILLALSLILLFTTAIIFNQSIIEHDTRNLLLIFIKILAGIGLFLSIFSKEKVEDERITLHKFRSLTAGFGMSIITYILVQVFELIDFNTSFTNSSVYPIYMGAIIYYSTFYGLQKEE